MTKQFKKFSDKKTTSSKGAISVIVALSVLVIILIIGLGAASTISGELAISGDSSDSIKAYYAAETGLERAMYKKFIDTTQTEAKECNSGWEIVDEMKFCLSISPSTLQSIGEYGSVRRSVELSF